MIEKERPLFKDSVIWKFITLVYLATIGKLSEKIQKSMMDVEYEARNNTPKDL